MVRDERSDAPSVVIVGGGLAGLAAAVALAERGIRSTLLESRPRLGGRASSIVDRVTGEAIDNCQHVSMGCCTNYAHFCRTIGAEDHFETAEALTFVGPTGKIDRFAATGGPAPFHLLRAFTRLSYLGHRDRLAIARGLRALAGYRRSSPDRRSFGDWLLQHGQTANAIENFWNVVLVSALSESLDRIDIGYARKVFIDSFLRHRNGWQVQIPTVPLDDLYGSPLIDWLQARGSVVRLSAGVEKLHATAERVTAVEVRGGERIEAAQVVLAVPWHLAGALLPAGLEDHPDLVGMSQLESAPISSVHLWFDRAFTELPHAVFVGRMSQWLFRRGVQSRNVVEPGGNGPLHYYQVVISASRELDSIPAERTIARVVDELADVWPEARAVRLVHSRLITEHRAVFSPLAGVDSMRPRQQSPIANLQLAGDWTRTGWPATMEGAVRSGYLAAENVLSRMGRPERVLQPDLPMAYLSQALFGL